MSPSYQIFTAFAAFGDGCIRALSERAGCFKESVGCTIEIVTSMRVVANWKVGCVRETG